MPFLRLNYSSKDSRKGKDNEVGGVFQKSTLNNSMFLTVCPSLCDFVRVPVVGTFGILDDSISIEFWRILCFFFQFKF